MTSKKKASHILGRDLNFDSKCYMADWFENRFKKRHSSLIQQLKNAKDLLEEELLEQYNNLFDKELHETGLYEIYYDVA